MDSNKEAARTKVGGKAALVPKLRFPEFRGGDEWKAAKVGELVDTVTPPKKLPTSAYNSAGEFPIIDQSQSDICGWTDDKEAVLYDGLPLIVFGDHTCVLKLINRPFAQGADGIKILKPLQSVGAPYLYQFLSYRPVVTEEYKRHYSILKEKVVAFPEFKSGEQQRIAECLSSADEVIAAQVRKVDALKTHKNGLMQLLFPCEGATQPRLRFLGEGEWAAEGLPEVVYFQEGPGIMAVDFRSDGVPLVRLAGVGGTTVTLDGCNFLDPARVAQKWDHFRLALNDLIISTSATFGRSSIVTKVAAGAVFYTGLIRFRPSSNRLELGYLQVYLGSPHFARQADLAAVGGGIKHFGPTHLKQMAIAIPPLGDQHRIAACLSSLDVLITAEARKLELLGRHRRGLMQQLFPAPRGGEA